MNVTGWLAGLPSAHTPWVLPGVMMDGLHRDLVFYFSRLGQQLAVWGVISDVTRTEQLS